MQKDIRKERSFRNPSFGLFVLLQIFLFIRILCIKEHTNFEEYFTVISAFLFATIHIENDTRSIATITALSLTLTADYFLVLSDPIRQLPAMVAFSITQLMYFVRILSETNKKNIAIDIIARGIVITIAETAAILLLGKKADALSIISVFYYVNLFANTAMAFLHVKKDPFFATGLFFFLCCDTIIGLTYASDVYLVYTEGSFLYHLSHSSINWGWAFYIPSQTLIALSLPFGKDASKKPHEVPASI